MNKAPWVLLLVVWSLLGCYDEKEGCLDPAALNFDVSADKDCCCEYPKLRLKVSYKNDSTSFSKLDYFEDADGDVYQIESFSFFLSHVEVKSDSGNWIDAEDSTEHWVYDEQGLPTRRLVSSNVVLVVDDMLKYDFGNFVDYGTFTEVRFELGMDELQMRVIPDSLPSGHALGFGEDSMWVSPGVYLQQKWVIMTDTAGRQVDTFSVSGANIPIDLTYDSAFVVQKGKDYELNIAIDILEWLKSIDWQADKAQIIEKLSNNSASAISLVQ